MPMWARPLLPSLSHTVATPLGWTHSSAGYVLRDPQLVMHALGVSAFSPVKRENKSNCVQVQRGSQVTRVHVAGGPAGRGQSVGGVSPRLGEAWPCPLGAQESSWDFSCSYPRL